MIRTHDTIVSKVVGNLKNIGTGPAWLVLVIQEGGAVRRQVPQRRARKGQV